MPKPADSDSVTGQDEPSWTLLDRDGLVDAYWTSSLPPSKPTDSTPRQNCRPTNGSTRRGFGASPTHSKNTTIPQSLKSANRLSASKTRLRVGNRPRRHRRRLLGDDFIVFDSIAAVEMLTIQYHAVSVTDYDGALATATATIEAEAASTDDDDSGSDGGTEGGRSNDDDTSDTDGSNSSDNDGGSVGGSDSTTEPAPRSTSSPTATPTPTAPGTDTPTPTETESADPTATPAATPAETETSTPPTTEPASGLFTPLAGVGGLVVVVAAILYYRRE